MPVNMISVDPGVEYYAAAMWVDSVLLSVALCPIGNRLKADLCVIEKPQVYGTHKTNVRSRDIEDLLFAAGRIAGRYPAYVAYLPAQWKGQVPKKVHHERILSALSQAEKSTLEGWTKGELGHILDAVGLGLHYLRRT